MVWYIHNGYIITLNVCAPNNRAVKYVKQKLVDKYTDVVEDINNLY
jgi:hypothetical protein